MSGSKRSKEIESTFTYQSYSGQMDFGGSMGGWFEFIPGSKSKPEGDGKPFRVRVPRFPLVGGELTECDDERAMFVY